VETIVQKRKAAAAARESRRQRRQLRILELEGQVPFAKDYDYKQLRHRKKPA
jgi:hypothetical protein